jgi:hypothetical protein
MIGAICGNLGAGKTLTLTFLGYQLWKFYGAEIYSNYNLAFPHKRIANIKELEKAGGGVFLADELWLWLDSRKYVSSPSEQINEILIKSRKRGFDIIYTEQFFKQIDLRLRRVTDMFIMPELSEKTGVCRVHYYNVFFERTRPPLLYDAKKIFPLYDTNEEIEKTDETKDDLSIRNYKKARMLAKAKEAGF